MFPSVSIVVDDADYFNQPSGHGFPGRCQEAANPPVRTCEQACVASFVLLKVLVGVSGLHGFTGESRITR